MNIMYADSIWKKACVYSVRVDVGVKELKIDPKTEFDKYDTYDTDYILALDKTIPAGACRVRFIEDEQTAKIERVNVISEYRKNGVGRALIEYAERFIASGGYDTIVITSKEEAVGFYEKLGYTPYYEEAFQSTVYRVIPMKKKIPIERN